jgi:hypothetical protein
MDVLKSIPAGAVKARAAVPAGDPPGAPLPDRHRPQVALPPLEVRYLPLCAAEAGGFRWRGAAGTWIIGAPWRAVIKLVCEGAMTVSRLRDIPGIGVDKVGDAADAAADPRFLRLENLDTDLRPPQVAVEATHAAIDRDDANSYLPFQGHLALREAACAHVAAITGRRYDPGSQCVSVAGGLNGILNVLLATVEPGQEVVICDPVYAGLVNRIRLAGGVPRFVSCTPGPGGWATDPGELAAAIGPRTAAVWSARSASPSKPSPPP